MPTSAPHLPILFRIQGTDGIRREVRLSTAPEVAGLTPQRAFLDRGLITETFMELYVFAHARALAEGGELRPGDAVVVAWDPRDPQGAFTGAVVRGLRRAGARVLLLRTAPTPLVPLFMLYKNAVAGFMVTASHNPKDQNGIKIFHAFRGLKLLPHNDAELTQRVLALDYRVVSAMPETGAVDDCAEEAAQLFLNYSLDPRNSWAGSVSFHDTVVVVDPANGALAGIAAEAFRRAGFAEVIETNAGKNGDVNLHSGVADLEGKRIITADMINPVAGAFHKHAAILRLFALGRCWRKEIDAGKRFVCGAVFDADGDRFYRLDYHPGKDALLVLSGDETAVLQARFLTARDPKRYKKAAFIHTVESDLNAGQAAADLGLKPVLAPVGDKWILLRIAALAAHARLGAIASHAARGNRKGAGRIQREAADIKRRMDADLRTGILDVRRFRDYEEQLARLERALGVDCGQPHIPLAVGAEETGHNITLGVLATGDGAGEMPVFCGNGLKSALNTFAAVQALFASEPVRTRLRALERPFPPGFKQTLYVYYVDKERFRNGSAVWQSVRRCLAAVASARGFRCRRLDFREDPDMLYLSLCPKRKRSGGKTGGECGVFVRNSGTEDKIGVNLRGGKQHARALRAIGSAVVEILFSTMKNPRSRHYRLELEALSQVAAGPLTEETLSVPAEARGRLLHEMQKQDLIALTAQGYRLTPRGRWYLATAPGA